MVKKKDDTSSDDVQLAVLDQAISQIRAKFGPESIHVPGEEILCDRERFATGIPPLDEALGGGGLAKGTIVEIYGSEGAGKSTLCLQIISQAQKIGMKTVFIDQEQALVPKYAESLGVDIGDMYIAQPSSMEEAFGITEALIKTGAIGLVVIDSLASLVPQAELEKEAGEQTMGIQPKQMSAWLRRINPVIAKTNTIIVFTNQLREKLGGYGNPEVTPGGRAMKFYASYRMQVAIKKKITNASGMITGNNLEITVVKNKYSQPYGKAEVIMNFGEGVDIVSAYVDTATSLGLFAKRGNWYVPNTTYILDGVDVGAGFNGKRKARDFFEENPNHLEELKEAIAILSVSEEEEEVLP